ncbi:hypothetical protein JAAARDRAFT_183930 [Jaapia argillacea MUCL 33604]|uniref:Zn(2)-C6 fungal-type domain-containing protein n=1 Tax=Jaapia argillacea MUCL 33604 TaxID=933084 RepID=A0A067PD10_9AGAM|nr:hypothetical protein JAAARDRAFT_183930 [Jaapia argillacea MUCL 33604]
MSSPEGDTNTNGGDYESGSKKRRVNRACDVCRRKKIRCNGGQTSNGQCSNCLAFNYQCTYLEGSKKNPPSERYVETLEMRLKKMEELLSKLNPSMELQGSTPSPSNSGSGSGPASASALTDPLRPLPPSASASNNDRSFFVPAARSPNPKTIPDYTEETEETEDEDALRGDHEYRYSPLSAQQSQDPQINPFRGRFIGRASGAMLVRTTATLKLNHTSEEEKPFWQGFFDQRRPAYWNPCPWEQTPDRGPVTLDFPENDLLNSLVGIYFRTTNLMVPLLHYPTFRRCLQEGLHLRDWGFGSTVLGVCAVASRSSDDPRVFLEGTGGAELSAGWKWFSQIELARPPLLNPQTLYDLQMYCLAAIYFQGSSVPHNAWVIIGMGLRLAQDVGAHSHKVYGATPTVEDELWKRAFWVLVSLDRLTSAGLGRPCALHDEEINVDLPIECDDEYWIDEDPDKAFKQPSSRPSTIAYFICFTKLNRILALILRSIYTLNKVVGTPGFAGPRKEQHIVVELDSALNKWVDSIPDHLRWDPHRTHPLFFTQSALLYAHYYHIQIMIHRPFIPSPRNPSTLSFPSLAICTNAARSCVHIMDLLFKRNGSVPPQMIMNVFSAGLVLLLNIWGGKKSGIFTDPEKEMEEVNKCMRVLKSVERRWYMAGRLWDIFCRLASAGDLPLPQATPPASYKRERDCDEPISKESSSAPSPAGSTDHRPTGPPRPVGENTRPFAEPQPVQPNHTDWTQSQFTLPIHSDELGRLPLQFDPNLFSDTFPPSDPLISQWLQTQRPTPSTQSVGSTSGAPLQTFFSTTSSSSGSSGYQSSPSVHPSPLGMSPVYHDQFSSMSGNIVAPPPGVHPDMTVTDSDIIAMWSQAPTSFQWEDWGAFLMGMGVDVHQEGTNFQSSNSNGP